MGISKDSAGNIYVTGTSTNVSHWIVRKSANGTAWSTIDDFVYASGQQALAYSAAVDGSGNIYVVGSAGPTKNHWIVRKSTNGGTSWTTVDDFQQKSNYDSQLINTIALRLLFDSSGNIYVAGVANEGGGYYGYSYKYWLVRRSNDGGSTWFTNEDVFSHLSHSATLSDISMDASGNIYTTGYMTTIYGTEWIIRKF